jgi:hypothetical protein
VIDEHLWGMVEEAPRADRAPLTGRQRPPHRRVPDPRLAARRQLDGVLGDCVGRRRLFGDILGAEWSAHVPIMPAG